MDDDRWDWAQADLWQQVQRDSAIVTLKAQLIDKNRFTKLGNISKRYMNLCVRISLLQDEVLSEIADSE